MACASHNMLEDTRFSPVFSRCVRFRLVEERCVEIIAVVHLDDIFAVGLKSRCDVFRDELNRMVPVKNLGELK